MNGATNDVFKTKNVTFSPICLSYLEEGYGLSLTDNASSLVMIGKCQKTGNYPEYFGMAF
jgi:hypothetical protein